MSEMVERVARAIRDGMPLEPTWEDWQEQAREAIAAMREPTEAMNLAGWLSPMSPPMSPPKWCWQAMIDAALK